MAVYKVKDYTIKTINYMEMDRIQLDLILINSGNNEDHRTYIITAEGARNTELANQNILDILTYGLDLAVNKGSNIEITEYLERNYVYFYLNTPNQRSRQQFKMTAIRI